jgi:polysaccharide biosynthesis transport protein
VSNHLSPGPPNQTFDSPSTAPPQEWNLAQCAQTLYRRRGLVAGITGLGILVAALLSLFQPRWYQSQASLELQGVNENFLDFRDIYPNLGADTDGTYLQTQAELVQQDSLIGQAIRKLHLEKRPEFQGSPEAATEALRKHLQVELARGSRILRITAEARDPQLAADAANELAGTFIEQTVRVRQQAARQTFDALNAQLQQIRNKLAESESRVKASRAPSGVLRSEADANRRFYEIMAQRVNEAAVASSIPQPNIRFIGRAQPASRPYKPNVPLNLAIGTFGGLLLALGSVLLREQTNSALRAPGEAGMYLTVPELGAIPRSPVRGSGAHPPVERAALEQRFSGVSEAFRATLASIFSAAGDGEHPRLLVVTSSQPMEGKTTVVSNLGIALAEISNRVLLIDGDMRRPRLHKVFDQANSWGLSDVLREKNAIEELPVEALVRKTAVPHLYLLPSGASPDNVFSLLYAGRLERLLPRFRQEFDYVLVDAPPCLEFADARIMARCAEHLLLVVRADYTDRQTAQAALRRLRLDGISVLGVILNRWDPAYSDGYAYAYQSGLARQDAR